MTREERRHHAWEIQDVVIRMVRHLDLGDIEAFASYFTEDGSWTRRGRTSNSRQEIIDSTKAVRSQTLVLRHVLTNFIVDFADDETAKATCYMSGARTDTGSEPSFPVPFTDQALWEYEDTFVKTKEGWRVKKRIAKPIFQRGN